jgi:hypothetical protein
LEGEDEMTTYMAMKQECKKTGFPKHYKEDFTKHDLAFLRRKDRRRVFGWILRECGTWVIIPGSEMSKVHIDYYVDDAKKGKAFYYIVDSDAEIVTPVAPDEMREWFKREADMAKYQAVRDEALAFKREYGGTVYILGGRPYDGTRHYEWCSKAAYDAFRVDRQLEIVAEF